MTEYIEVHVYSDAHDGTPTEIREHTVLSEAFQDAHSAASELATEPGEVKFGTGRDSEACELYPEFGAGTVVVKSLSE